MILTQGKIAKEVFPGKGGIFILWLLSVNVEKVLNLESWALVINGQKTGATSAKFQLKYQTRDFSWQQVQERKELQIF